jgi:hypothetical protein
MKASEFFKQGKYYKCILEQSNYFTVGKVYKCFGYKDNGEYAKYTYMEVNKGSTSRRIIKDGVEANGLGDGWWTHDIRLYFKQVRTKSHLPEWW